MDRRNTVSSYQEVIRRAFAEQVAKGRYSASFEHVRTSKEFFRKVMQECVREVLGEEVEPSGL